MRYWGHLCCRPQHGVEVLKWAWRKRSLQPGSTACSIGRAPGTYRQTLAKLKLTVTLRPEAVSLLLSSREHCCRVLWQCYSRGQEECFGQHTSSPVLLLSLGQDFTWKGSQRCIAKRARDYSSLLPIVITYPCKTVMTRQQEPLYSLLQFQSNVPGLFHYLDINKLTQKEGGNFLHVLHIIFPIWLLSCLPFPPFCGDKSKAKNIFMDHRQ